MTGKIVSIMNYGIFIELEKGIEGLIHISEISWTKNIQNLPDQYKVGDSLESKILFIDANEQKISLGIKQLTQDPWNDISSQVSIGDKKEGAVNKVTKFGAYVDLGEDIEGFIRNTDFHWTKNPLHPKEFVNEGDKIKFVVVDISDKDRKILLSMKDLAENPWSDIVEKYSAGDKLKGTVSAINDAGVVVDMGDDIVGLVPSDQISKELKKDYLPSIEPGGTIDLLVVEVKEKDKNVILMLDQPDAD
jgi:small subunit ribosomal protein S1